MAAGIASPELTLSIATQENEAAAAALIAEVREFQKCCHHRYRFNNFFDVTLSVLGLLLSIAVVAAGFLKRPEVSAVLGAVVAAVLSAQRAFPFGQRVMFYRLLEGQSDNLMTRIQQGLLSRKDAVDVLSSLRMDFAQQLPRGATAADRSPSPTDAGASQDAGQQLLPLSVPSPSPAVAAVYSQRDCDSSSKAGL